MQRATMRCMSRRKRVILIALVWAAATILCVLPWVWPAYAHVLGNGLLVHYETLFTGVVLGWLTKDALNRRHTNAPVIRNFTGKLTAGELAEFKERLDAAVRDSGHHAWPTPVGPGDSES